MTRIERPFAFLHSITSVLLALVLFVGWITGVPIQNAAYPVMIIFLITGALIAFNLSVIPFPRDGK